MRIELTVRGKDGEVMDAAIVAEPETPLGAVRAQLVAAGLAAAEAELWHDGKLLRTDSRLANSRLSTGAVLDVGPCDPARRRPSASLDVVGGPSAGARHPLVTGNLTIGRSPTCTVLLRGDADVSRVHAVLDVTAHGVTLRDGGSTNGTFVDGVRIVAPEPLRAGQLVRVGDSLLHLRSATPSPAAVRDAGLARLVNRPPRPPRGGEPPQFSVPAAPRAGRPQRVQLVATVLPAAAGVAFAWTLHAAQFLCFALLSPVMLLATSLGDRVHWRRSRRREASTYRAALRGFETELRAALRDEAAARRAAHPDPAELADIASLPAVRLWERRRGDDDALEVRLGLADLPSGAVLHDGGVVRPAGTCTAVPLVARLRDGPLGVAAPAAAARAAGRWVLGQLCVLHSPADLEIALLLGPRHEEWHWARWLPHLRGRVATDAAQGEDLVAGLTALAEGRRRSARAAGGRWCGPWLVVLVDAVSMGTQRPAMGPLLNAVAVGISVVWLDTTAEGLPPGCAAVAVACGETGTRVRLRSVAGELPEAVLDQVRVGWADGIARALAPLADDADVAAALPDSCRLGEFLGAGAPDARWVEQSWAQADGGASTVLGATEDGPCQLDLVRDGPHALIAGTTGAGKSELLQTLVVGLATAYPPEQLCFLLVDFKGGAAFADCARLPHTTGLVTDLDALRTRRALQALDAELTRRERLFARAGVADLTAYRASEPDEPVPRLVLVVDEFAALAEDLPDFIRGLVGVAQRGRSLGLHLVLATQRPGSAVSPEIRANTSARICLRVTDASESIDVIDAPDAAGLDRRLPGRGLLRIGSTLTAFQAAHVGAPARDSSRAAVTLEPLGPWRSPPHHGTQAAGTEVTELAELVDALCTAARRTGRRPAASPWREPLPERLPLDGPGIDAAGADGNGWSVRLGLVDLPAAQRQEPLCFDLTHGPSLVLAGGGRSGRSTALVTLAVQAARALSPAWLHVHAIDPTSGVAALRALPHCGTYAGPDGADTAAKLVDRLTGELQQRRRLLAEWGLPSAAEARAAGRALPLTMLLVDGWELVCAAADEHDAGRTTEALLTLARTGPSAGIVVAAAGDRGVFAPRVAAAFGERLVLALAERADFGLTGIAARDVPDHLPPGRGVRCRDGVEFQLGFSGASPSRTEQDRVIAAIPAVSEPDDGGLLRRVRIRPLPTDVRLSDLARPAGQVLIGVGGDAAGPVGVRIAGGTTMLVAGPPRSGRTSLLRTLLVQLAADGAQVAVAASARSALAADAERAGLPVLGPDEGLSERGERPLVVLLDDLDRFEDGRLAEQLGARLRGDGGELFLVATARTDELATAYRGLGAVLRRTRSGVLLRPGPVDGDVLGVRLPRHRDPGPPGRGVLVGDPAWDARFRDEPAIPIQVARQ